MKPPIYMVILPLGKHQMVALYRVIECVRTQSAVRRTTHLISINKMPLGMRAFGFNFANWPLRVVAQTWIRTLGLLILINVLLIYP